MVRSGASGLVNQDQKIAAFGSSYGDLWLGCACYVQMILRLAQCVGEGYGLSAQLIFRVIWRD